MRRVASIEVPPGGGAEAEKKNPPLETFRASVKCSDLSEARPTARKRSGVRTGCRGTCRLSEADMMAILLPARKGGTQSLQGCGSLRIHSGQPTDRVQARNPHKTRSYSAVPF